MELSKLTPIEKLEVVKEKLANGWELSAPYSTEREPLRRALLKPPMSHTHWADATLWVHIVDANVNGERCNVFAPEWIVTYTEQSLNNNLEGKKW